MSIRVPSIDFIEELKWRGLFNQCTDEDALREHLKSGVRSAYIGYDPTAPSLTIGNLVTIMLLVHFWRAGHVPVAIVGGGTGMIGDPSGKSAERTLMTEETVRANIAGQSTIFGRLFENAAKLEGREKFQPKLINNGDWLMKIGFIEALRDIGKHFSVNEMIKRDSVRDRLEKRDQGISYTEFSYILLQSYDFLVLFRDFAKHGLKQPVTLQMGGSDQWGNILGGISLVSRAFYDSVVTLCKAVGIAKLFVDDPSRLREVVSTPELDLIERVTTFAHQLQAWIEAVGQYQSTRTVPDEFLYKTVLAAGNMAPITPEDTDAIVKDIASRWISFGLTCPLATKADGGKFGKTETGAVWLTADRTSPYAYHQFWLNAADADVMRFLKIFTLLPKERIEAIEAEHLADPAKRVAQRELADAATALLHGPEAVEQAKAAAAALFSGNVASLPAAAFKEALADVPTTEHPRATLEAGVSLLDLLPQTSLAKSKSEARQFVTEGSISVNGTKHDGKAPLTVNELLHGEYIALRRGKKNWHVTRWR
jgi:tyrosyl-tRNA synthetase